MAFTQESTDAISIDIHRRELRIVGNAFDINRVLQACQNAMQYIEHNKMGTHEPVTVYVRAPQDDE